MPNNVLYAQMHDAFLIIDFVVIYILCCVNKDFIIITNCRTRSRYTVRPWLSSNINIVSRVDGGGGRGKGGGGSTHGALGGGGGGGGGSGEGGGSTHGALGGHQLDRFLARHFGF